MTKNSFVTEVTFKERTWVIGRKWVIWFKPVNHLSANPTKWSNTLKQFVGPTNSLSEFNHFVWLALKGLKFKTKLNMLESWGQYYISNACN